MLDLIRGYYNRVVDWIRTYHISVLITVEKLLPEPEEQEFNQDRPSDMTAITMADLDLGDMHIECPQCGEPTCSVMAGLTTLEVEKEGESALPSLEQVGVVLYPCEHHFVSPHLADKVASIMNSRENGHLDLDQVLDLIEVRHPER